MITSATVLSYGVGVDSTAMLVELDARRTPPDLVLFSDPGAENPITYQYLQMMTRWMDDRGIANAQVSHRTTRLRSHPPYAGLYESLLVNACLPSIAFGRHSCSLKYKLAPQHRFLAHWPTAIDVWASGGTVTMLVGLDAGPRDSQRFAHARDIAHQGYVTRYPLREWQWDRDRCVHRIREAGLPVPPKSSCWLLCLQMVSRLTATLYLWATKLSAV